MQSQTFAQVASPRTVRRADGREFPISDFGASAAQPRKLLIVLGYHNGDIDSVEALGDIIAQIERVRNVEADIAIYARHDARAFSENTRKSLEAKFNVVHTLRCRRRDGTTYPFASNEMFYDLVTLMGQEPKWAVDYHSFINLEGDCVPLRADWIKVLVQEFKNAASRGFAAIGHIHDNPIRHMNGVGVYAIDIVKRVVGNRLVGGNATICYDIDQAKNILPLCMDTSAIYFEYRVPTITPEDLFKERKDGIVPALFHGVKDDSARRAVTARLVAFTQKVEPKVRPNVFTYFHPIEDNNMAEHQSILKMWQEGWRSRGFNPIVLTAKEAVKNKHYVAFVAACERLPAVIRKETQMNRFTRWLALDTVGGGLLTDYDVVPGKLTPDILGTLTGFHVSRPRDIPAIIMAFIDAPALLKWLDRIQNYTQQPDDTVDGRQNIVDANVLKNCVIEDHVQPENWIMNFGEPGWWNAQAVHFAGAAIARTSEKTQRKSFLMDRFLRGEMGDPSQGPAIMQSSGLNPAVRPAPAVAGRPPEGAVRETPDLSDVVADLESENQKLREELAALKASKSAKAPVLASVAAEDPPAAAVDENHPGAL